MNPIVQCTCIGYLPKSATRSIVLFHKRLCEGKKKHAFLVVFLPFRLCPHEKKGGFFLLLLLSQSALLSFHEPIFFLWRKAACMPVSFLLRACYSPGLICHVMGGGQLLNLHSHRFASVSTLNPPISCSLVRESCLSHWDFSQLSVHPIDTPVYCGNSPGARVY